MPRVLVKQIQFLQVCLQKEGLVLGRQDVVGKGAEYGP